MFGTYSSLYGPFGAGIAAVVRIHGSAVIFVLGAELAALLVASAHSSGPRAAGALSRTTAQEASV